jgi:hypothetical protein
MQYNEYSSTYDSRRGNTLLVDKLLSINHEHAFKISMTYINRDIFKQCCLRASLSDIELNIFIIYSRILYTNKGPERLTDDEYDNLIKSCTSLLVIKVLLILKCGMKL